MAVEKNDVKKRKRALLIRGIVLAAVLVFMTTVGILHQVGGATKPAGVDALCPFGAIESAYRVITEGRLVSRIAWSSFALFAAVLISAFLFRRSFCGNLCPLGTLQEGAGWLGKKLLKKRLVFPKAFDRIARWLKVGVLAFIIVMTIRTASLFIRPIDPWAAWMHASSAELFTEFLLGFIVLVVSLVGSFFYERFFCKYLCPMGAVLSPFSRIGLFKIKRDAATCIDCKACDKACPVNIEVSKADKVVSGECLDCDKCVNACPVQGALTVEGPGKKKLSPVVRVLVTLGIFGVVILVSRLTGLVSFEQQSVEKRAEGLQAIQSGEAPEHKTVAVIEDFSAAIKGSDTWEGLIKASGIPYEAFAERFKLPESRLAEKLNVMAHDTASGFEMEDVRDFVKEKMLELNR